MQFVESACASRRKGRTKNAMQQKCDNMYNKQVFYYLKMMKRMLNIKAAR